MITAYSKETSWRNKVNKMEKQREVDSEKEKEREWDKERCLMRTD